MMTRSLTMTAPTAGFGAVRPSPRRPSSSASAMKRRSSAFVVVSIVIHERSFSPPPAKRRGGVGGGGNSGEVKRGRAPHPGSFAADPPRRSQALAGGGKSRTSFLNLRIRLGLVRQFGERRREIFRLAEVLVDGREAHI